MTVKVVLLMLLMASIAAGSLFGARADAKPNET
jgi:hypothetical protein